MLSEIGNSPPGARWRRLEMATRDVDELAFALPGWPQRYLKVDDEAFEGRLSVWAGPGIQVFLERTRGRILEEGATRPGSVGLALPLAASGEALSLGTRVQPGATVMTMAAPREIFLHTPARFELLGISVDRTKFLDHAAGSADLPAVARRSHVCQVHPGTARELTDRLLQAVGLPAGPVCAEAFGLSLLDTMAEVLAECEPLPTPPRSGACRDLVSAAQRLVASALQAGDEGSLDVAEVCRQLAVPRRTLQYGFRSVLDIGPLHYVKAVRLAGARRSLRQGEGGVHDVAVRWGFGHFGAFSRDYRLRFGELPSATLAAR